MAKQPKKRTTPATGAAPVAGSVAEAETTGIETASSAISIPIVVLGTADALPLLTEVWKHKAPGAAIIPFEQGPGPFSEVIDRLMEDDGIPDSFILVPANCFPTHRVTFADLVIYRVRRMKPTAASDKWEVTPQTGLPFIFQATAALRTFEQLDDTYTEEEFLKVYNENAHPGELPEEIGMSFGNTVSYAVRRPKCMSAVAEALVRKRFICATGEGFTAIKDRLALLVSDGR